MKRLFAALLLLAAAAPASAASFSINPTRIVLAPGASSAVIALRNDSTEEVRFQVTSFAWNNSLAGQMLLTDSGDVVAFPTVMAIAPNSVRKIRVAVTREAQGQELSYRLVLRQLPSKAQADPTGVTMLTEFNVPVFVQPQERRATAVLDPIHVEGGHADVTLHNRGAVHVTPEKLEVTAFDRSGAQLWTRSLPAWYLLPGEDRALSLDVPALGCAAKLVATVRFQEVAQPLTETASLSGASCSR